MTSATDEMKQSAAMKALLDAKLQEITAYTIIGRTDMVDVRKDEAHALLDAHMTALIAHACAVVAEADRKGQA